MTYNHFRNSSHVLNIILVACYAIATLYPAAELTRLIMLSGFKQFPWMFNDFVFELFSIWFCYLGTVVTSVILIYRVNPVEGKAHVTRHSQ